ncbi:MAG: DNA mismatch repair protein MutS [Thermodesulfobacteriota bacterium]
MQPTSVTDQAMDSEKLIIELNYRNKIIDERRKDAPFDSRKMFDLLPETIIDKRTLAMIEIHDLFKAVDHCQTHVGSARLFHSLMNPSESIELVHARQDSYCEVESNDRLRSAIEEYLAIFREGETALFKLLNAHMLPLLPYSDFKEAMRAITRMHKAASALPQPDTVYLDSLLRTIQSFSLSPVSDLAAGPTYRTFSEIYSRKEKGFMPALRFRPGRVSGGSIWPSLPFFYGAAGWLFGFIEPAVAESIVILTCGGTLIGVLYGSLAKPMIDYETAILPIRKRVYDSNRFAQAVEAVAAIDELLSFVSYSKAMSHPTVIPEVSNGPCHYFVARELRNPIRAKTEPGFVGNDVNLEGSRVSFITGPNSGGKTTYCKTIVQNQLLGQIGGPVVAQSARMNMADCIRYQAPAFDSLNDPEGRFGTELKVTKEIFYKMTPKSLAVLDEIAEGTTTHEKMRLSMDIMNGFYAIGNNTLLVTHSYELVDNFRTQQKGQYLQVEFAGDAPTHRLVEGISRDSHALRVAKKIGFSPEDISRYLREKNYQLPNEP